MNGATEATLQDLLAVAQAMNANMVGLNRLLSQAGSGSGGGGASAAGAALGGLSRAAGPASIALNALKAAGGLVSSAFGLLGSIIGKTITGLTATIGNLYEFAKSAAMGTAKLSDFYNAFRDLPFFIGNLFSLAADIIRYQEGLLDFYRQMSSAGATFGGSLSEMRRMAAQGFMSMTELVRVVRENSEVFATLGGNVDAGTRKFIETQNKLLGPGSRYSQQLLGLGYTAEQISGMLTNVYNSQSTLNRTEIQNANKVAEAVAMSARELDLFSRATGKNREELEKQQKKLSLDTAFKTFTSSITDPKQRAAMEQAITKTISMAGEDAGDLLKQMFMTGGDIAIPLTEGSKQFMVAMGDQAEPMLRALYDIALNPTMDGAERLRAQMGVFYDMAGTFKGNILDPLGKQGAFLQLMNNRTVGQLNLQALLQKRENLTREEFVAQATKAAQKQGEAAMGSAGALAQAQVNIKNFGAGIMDLVYQLVGPIAKHLINFGNQMTGHLFPLFTGIINWFKGTLDELRQAFGKGDEAGWKNMFKKLGEKLIQGAGNVRDFISPLFEAMKPVFSKFMTDIAPILQTGFMTVFDFIIYALRKNSVIARLLLGESNQERKEERQRMLESGQFQRNVERYEQEYNRMSPEARLSEYGKSLLAMLQDAQQQLESARREFGQQQSNPTVSNRDRRHSGTLGMTGNWWEKENKVVEIQAGETVATQAQIAQIVGAASQNGMAEAVSSLNSSIRTLISVSQRIEENTKANVAATKRLDGNVFSMV